MGRHREMERGGGERVQLRDNKTLEWGGSRRFRCGRNRRLSDFGDTVEKQQCEQIVVSGANHYKFIENNLIPGIAQMKTIAYIVRPIFGRRLSIDGQSRARGRYTALETHFYPTL